MERERSTSLNQLRKKQVEVEEVRQEVQKKEKQAAELSASIMCVVYSFLLIQVILKVLLHWFCLMDLNCITPVYVTGTHGVSP